MNTILEYGTGMTDIETGELPTKSFVQIEGSVRAKSQFAPVGGIVTVKTPINSFPVAINGAPQLQPLVRVAVSAFRASDINGEIPVHVYDSPQIGAPLSMPHVRIILTNAIITTDPCLQILATIEAFNTGSGDQVDVVTPYNQSISTTTIVEGSPKDCIVYSIDQSRYTAKDSQGHDVSVIWSDQVVMFTEVMITLKSLTLTS